MNSSTAQPRAPQYGAPTRKSPAMGNWQSPSDKYFTITDPPNECPIKAALLPPTGRDDCKAIFHAMYRGFSGVGMGGLWSKKSLPSDLASLSTKLLLPSWSFCGPALCTKNISFFIDDFSRKTQKTQNDLRILFRGFRAFRESYTNVSLAVSLYRVQFRHYAGLITTRAFFRFEL